ncbi:MAG: phosphoribosylamine--glycine ligase [Candidatus Izemoplasmatales bacterium]|jgi:phosphoribosylamine--glycine ligase
MKVLVIGSGGREHALVRKMRLDDPKTAIYAIPGNPGMASDAICVKLPLDNLEKLAEFAQNNKIDLTFVGSEEPLSRGIVDLFTDAGCPIFGPSKAAAQIETSKKFAKELMTKYHIPTAAYRVFSDCGSAKEYLKTETFPIVIKADGLAAGKGVVIAGSQKEAEDACDLLLEKHRAIVIEEYLQGIEFSLMTLVHQDQVVPLAIAQDYKRVHDGNLGPNTGGMGAYSPVPQIPSQVVRKAMELIMIPVAKALVKENIPFTGVLYGGLMWTKNGVKVIEFNARFGDPETEVILPRMRTKLLPAIHRFLDKKTVKLSFSKEAAVGVVLASNGYPGKYDVGLPTNIPLDDPLVLHMGTKMDKGNVLTAGGRVAIVVARGKTLQDARQEAYRKVESIKSSGLFFRKDIAGF